jgi:mono/diheme cytochrome c family protein
MRAAMPKIPDFTDRAWQDLHPIPELRAIIRNGKELMPAFDDQRVSDDQLNGLLAYVRAFAPGAGPAAETPAAPDDFDERFQRLQGEWDALQKQMDELSKKPNGP